MGDAAHILSFLWTGLYHHIKGRYNALSPGTGSQKRGIKTGI